MDVLILIVSYNGSKTIRQTVESCLTRTENMPVLVVDNCSTDNTLDILRSIPNYRLHIVSMGYNSGLGCAFNAGIHAAETFGLRWLFILDQDSLITDGCLEKLFITGQRLIKPIGSVSAIAPTIRCKEYPDIIHYPLKWSGKQFLPHIQGDQNDECHCIPVDSPISSGTLYRVDALKTIGGFNETYFIDFIDHECHLRLINAGFTLWWQTNAEIYHRLGNIQRMTPNGLWIEHESFRYYYMARNMTEGYYRLGGVKAVLLFWQEAFRHCRRLYSNSQKPFAGIFFIVKGCFDAIIGKSGKLASDH